MQQLWTDPVKQINWSTGWGRDTRTARARPRPPGLTCPPPFCQSAVSPIVSGDFGPPHRDRAAMSSRVSFSQLRLEAEVDRYRAECQWPKVLLTVEQMHAARIHEDGEWETHLDRWGPGTSRVQVRNPEEEPELHEKVLLFKVTGSC